MKMRIVLVALIGCVASVSQAVDIFTDTFDRASTTDGNIDVSIDGMVGSAYFTPVATNTWLETTSTPIIFPNIAQNQVALDNKCAVVFNHNLIDPVILSEGLLSVEIDYTSFGDVVNSSGYGRLSGFGIGLSMIQASQLQDDVRADADLWIGFVSPNTIEVLSFGSVVASNTVENAGGGKFNLTLDPESFVSGANVDYTVTFLPNNGEPSMLFSGSFAWDATDENYFSMSANPWGSARADNFKVKALTANGPAAAPTGLSAVGSLREIALSWNANSESNIVFYNLYSGDSALSATNLLASTSGTNYLHTGLGDAQTVYYSLTAVDNTGVSSPASAVVSDITNADDGPPSAPVNLVTQPVTQAATLSWDANSEIDVVSYNIYSGTSEGAVNVFVINVTETNAFVSPLLGGITNWLAVTAVDIHGNESAPSTAVSVFVPGGVRLNKTIASADFNIVNDVSPSASTTFDLMTDGYTVNVTVTVTSTGTGIGALRRTSGFIAIITGNADFIDGADELTVSYVVNSITGPDDLVVSSSEFTGFSGAGSVSDISVNGALVSSGFDTYAFGNNTTFQSGDQAGGSDPRVRMGDLYFELVLSQLSVEPPVLTIFSSGNEVWVGSTNLDSRATYRLLESATLVYGQWTTNTTFSGVTATNIVVPTTGKANSNFRMIGE